MLSSLQFLIHRHVPPNIHWVFDLSSWGSISHQVLWGNIRNDKELTKICTPNRVLALQLTEQALQHRLRWIRHTYPVFTAKISEPAQIIIPIPLKIYRTIQSSLNDSPAWCGVKLTDRFDDLPIRIRLQIEYTSRVSLSVIKCFLQSVWKMKW